MLVKNCMTPNPITVKPNDNVEEVFNLLRKKKFRQAPVVKEGKLVGIVTDRDLRPAIMVEDHLVVADVMNYHPIKVSEDLTLEEAARIVRLSKINALPVISKTDELVGILSVTDILDGFINLLGFHTNPTRLEVKIGEGEDLYDVIKLLKTCSDKVVSFSSFENCPGIFHFWVIGCDMDKVKRILDVSKLDITVRK